jgi:DNA integrity scanning protein DisA with diadenylate cyclase activity
VSIEFLKEIEISELLDILFMSVLIYTVLVWFKRTKATFVLTGIIIVGLVYLLARMFNLVLTTFVLQAFFAVILVAIIVIFQDELRQLFGRVPEKLRQFFEQIPEKLRQFFEQIPIWGLSNDSDKQRSTGSSRREIEILARALIDLAKDKTGALIVIPGKDILIRYLDGGVDLNGEISEPLLKSLFDKHSIGHDGAVILEKGRISKFSCHLPLSKNFAKLRNLGTRHAAALGLSELTDAMCLVVSEERGTIAAARNGEIRQIGPEQLILLLENFYEEMSPYGSTKPWYSLFTKNFREKAIAFLITIALWFIFVYGSRQVYRSFIIPVDSSAILSQHEITDIEPKELKVTFSGEHRAFYLLNENEIKLSLKIPNSVEDGIKTIIVSESNISYPKDIKLEAIEPHSIEVRLKTENQAR